MKPITLAMSEDSDPEHSRSPKRRRINGNVDEESPDELAASSEPENSSYLQRSRQENSQQLRRQSFDTSSSVDSPDELDHTIYTFWRDGWNSRSQRQSQRESHDAPSPEPPTPEAPTPEAPTPEVPTPEVHTPEPPSPETPSIDAPHKNAPLRDAIPPNGPSDQSPVPSHGATTPPKRKASFVRYRQKMILRGHRRGVAAVRFSPDGRLIASCSADATIRIWNTATGKQLHILEGHLAGISTIAWSPDSKTLASGSDDKAIRLWDVETAKAYPKAFLGHHNYIYSIAFSPKGNMLISGSYDEAVFLWDVRTARVMRSIPAHSDPIGGVDFIRDGTLFVSCAGDGLMCVVEISSSELQFPFIIPIESSIKNTSPFSRISAPLDESIVADYLISRIWDTATGQCLRTLVHEDNAPVTSVRFSRNGKFVLAWTLDSCLRLWNYVEGRCTKTYQGHTNIKFSLTGGFGIYGGSDDEGEEQAAFVVSGSEDGNILWWDVQSKAILQKETGHEGVVLGVDIWDPESLVVSCSLDKTVRVWEKDDGDSEGDEVINGEKHQGGHDEDVDGFEDYHEGDQEVDGEGNEGSLEEPEGGSEVDLEEGQGKAHEGEDEEHEPLQKNNGEEHGKSDTEERDEEVDEEDNTEAENESNFG